MPMRVIDREEASERLTHEACIPLVRKAMIAFSGGTTRQNDEKITACKSLGHIVPDLAAVNRLYGMSSPLTFRASRTPLHPRRPSSVSRRGTHLPCT